VLTVALDQRSVVKAVTNTHGGVDSIAGVGSSGYTSARVDVVNAVLTSNRLGCLQQRLRSHIHHLLSYHVLCAPG